MLPNMRQHFTSSLAWSSHPEPGLRAGFVAPFGPGSVACLGTSPTIVRDPFLSCEWPFARTRIAQVFHYMQPMLLTVRAIPKPASKPEDVEAHAHKERVAYNGRAGSEASYRPWPEWCYEART